MIRLNEWLSRGCIKIVNAIHTSYSINRVSTSRIGSQDEIREEHAVNVRKFLISYYRSYRYKDTLNR